LFAKYITAVIYTKLFVLFLAAVSIGLALALAGKGYLLVFRAGLLYFPKRMLRGDLVLLYFCNLDYDNDLLYFLFLLIIVENAIGPIVATMGLLILCTIVTLMPLQLFDSVRPYLFTSYLDLWQKSIRSGHSLE